MAQPKKGLVRQLPEGLRVGGRNPEAIAKQAAAILLSAWVDGCRNGEEFFNPEWIGEVE